MNGLLLKGYVSFHAHGTCNSFGDRRFSAGGPRVWNALPLYLRQDTSYRRQFTQSLKGHMFRL